MPSLKIPIRLQSGNETSESYQHRKIFKAMSMIWEKVEKDGKGI